MLGKRLIESAVVAHPVSHTPATMRGESKPITSVFFDQEKQREA